MVTPSRARVWLMLILAALALVNLKTIDATEWLGDGGDIPQMERRFKQLLPFLPKRGKVGYIADVNPGSGDAPADVIREYFVAQYALVPLVLVLGNKERLLIANFSDPTVMGDQVADLELIKDFGTGLMLFRNRE